MINPEKIFTFSFTNGKTINENHHSPLGGEGGG
jgi:hypothetical protein